MTGSGATKRPRAMRAAGSGTQSIDRAIALLREVGMFGRPGARISDLMRNCDLEYPTAHRILKSLVANELLAKDPVTRRYRLGQLVYELSLAVEPTLDVRRYCDAMTTRLAEVTGDTIFLTVRSGRDVVCIDRKEGSYPIRTFLFDIGSRRPLGVGAAGIALLMSDPQDQVDAIVSANQSRYEGWGKVTAEHVLATVSRAREVGYVVIGDIVFPGVRAVSLPFGYSGGQAMAAVSVAAISSRVPKARILELVSLIESEIARLPHLDNSRNA